MINNCLWVFFFFLFYLKTSTVNGAVCTLFYMHLYRLLGLLIEFGMKDDLRKIEVGGVSSHDLYVKREFQYAAMSLEEGICMHAPGKQHISSGHIVWQTKRSHLLPSRVYSGAILHRTKLLWCCLSRCQPPRSVWALCEGPPRLHAHGL